MTDLSSRERHLVIVFDICSSTTILEDLKRTDNLGAWRGLMIELKDHLLEKGTALGMNLYKFIGDGWVLLFPDGVPKLQLCTLLEELSKRYEAQFDSEVRPLLSQDPSPVGLMFGIDSGELIRMELNGQCEYIGRAINVASRLQSYTKELPGGPSYKVIFSKNSFNSPPPPPTGLSVEPIKVSLRNISPATMQCFTLQVHSGKTGRTSGVGAATPAKPARVARDSSARLEPVKTGPDIRATDMRTIQIASLGGVGKWTVHRSGQWGAVVQFTNEARRGAAASAGAEVTAKAHLIYRVGEKESLRVRGSWLDGYDLARFNVSDSHSLIVGIGEGRMFSAVETVRRPSGGVERLETRLARFDSVPEKLVVLVQLTEVDGGSILYEGEFAIATSPLSVLALR